MNQLKIINLLTLSIMLLCFNLSSAYWQGWRCVTEHNKGCHEHDHEWGPDDHGGMPSSTSPKGVEMIKKSEGLELNAYKLDGDKKWTIGYGHTLNVKEGDVITESQAGEFLIEDLKNAQDAVARLVTVPLNQNQYDALVSLMYNIGGGDKWKDYILLKKLNEGDYDGAAEQFDTFRLVNGTVSQGLVNRRKIERELFEKKVD